MLDFRMLGITASLVKAFIALKSRTYHDVDAGRPSSTLSLNLNLAKENLT